MAPGERFDIATLYNNIYYFPVEEREALLAHIRSFLKPGGFLLLTTCCQGGSPGLGALNLWGAATRGAGRLPTEDELVHQLQQAGYGGVKTTNLVPGVPLRGIPGVLFVKGPARPPNRTTGRAYSFSPTDFACVNKTDSPARPPSSPCPTY